MSDALKAGYKPDIKPTITAKAMPSKTPSATIGNGIFRAKEAILITAEESRMPIAAPVNEKIKDSVRK